METSNTRHGDENRFYKYKDMLYRIAFSNMKNKADAEDAVQEAFLHRMRANTVFENEEHEKAWFIRTLLHICIDIHKSAWFQKTVSIEAVPELEIKNFYIPYIEEDETLFIVMGLPVQYRMPLYLFYYEDCSIKEIAHILDMPEATVKTRLKRGREAVKKVIIKGKEG